jgi:hypothetical protein
MRSMNIAFCAGSLGIALLCFLGILFVAQAIFAAEYPWKLRVKEDGITVYTRRVEGSPILQFKSDMIVNASLDKVVSFFEDEKIIPQWFHQCTRAELLEANGPDQKVLYFVVHLPWPVTERDSIFRRVRTTDPKTGAVTYVATALPERLPVAKGRIRVQALNSTWRFAPLEGGRTEIYFDQHSDPGGFIPPFIVNKLVVDMPVNSFRNMRRMILEGDKKQLK